MRISLLLTSILLLTFISSTYGQVEPPEIKSVSVNSDGSVDISWEKSSTPGVSGYILYKYLCTGLNCNHIEYSYFTPTGLNPYPDLKANADEYSESYKLAAFVGDTTNLSEATRAHNTLYLDIAVYDSCALSITLQWTPYTGWNDEVNYVLYRDSGSGFQEISSLSDTSFTDTDLLERAFYSYYIEAISPSGDTAGSNIVDNYTMVPPTPNQNDFQASNIVFDGSKVDISLDVFPLNFMSAYNLLYSSSPSDGFEYYTGHSNTGGGTYTFTDDTNGELQPLYYRLEGVNICDIRNVSNTVQPIKLSIDRDLNDLRLYWNPSFYSDLSETYTIFYSIDGAAPQQLDFGLSETEYFTNLDNVGSGAGESFCFFVQSENSMSYKSISNTTCETRLPEFRIPNAFTPNGDGLNDYFGPIWVKGAKPDDGGDNGYIFNVEIVDFKFIVYDKYGGRIFSTDKVYKKWFGDALGTGQKVVEGPYQYYLWFKTMQDKTYEKSGVINVLYP